MRGYILSKTGLEKVEYVISVENKLSRRQISRETCLNRGTITKVLQGEKPVNLQTIRTLLGSFGIPLDLADYWKVSSTNKKNMGQNKEDYDRLISAALRIEELASLEENETRKQELLDQAQDLRARAANLPDDDD